LRRTRGTRATAASTRRFGTYDPNYSPARIHLKQDRLEHWLKLGAQPSATVAQLIKLGEEVRGAAGQPVAPCRISSR